MTTPTTMMDTFPSVFRLGEETPRAQLVNRTATGIVAWSSISTIQVEAIGDGSKP